MSTTRTLQPADQIAQYRVVGPIGAGGMGEVYLAQDQSLERNVALKVLPPDVTRSEDRVRRFMQEAKSASSLNHPNIVTIYEIGQEPVKSASGTGDSGPVHFISMELISGRTLGAKIHEEKTELRTLLGYLAQAAEGIAKAHAAGIIHRDLKPGNIMVSDDGFAKVLDFGLAKLTEKYGTSGPNEATEVAERTSEGAVMGTIHYMSPEQVQGKAVDARSDIFSFGCLLYEAATRQRPFIADSNVETMHKILHDKPRPIEELNTAAPAELRRVIRRCLAKAPDQRAQSMKDIAIELREIVDEYDTLSASTTSATTSGSGATAPLVMRKSRMMPVVVGAVLVAAAGIGYGLWNSRRGGEPGQQPFQTMRLTTQTSRGDVTDCAISPDGRYLAYTAGKSGRMTMRVRQVATGSDVEVLPMQEGLLEFPCFTPDGNYLFFCRRKPDTPLYRVLMSVPSLGGQEQERGFDVDSRVAFSPDGKHVCYVRNYPQKQYAAVILYDLDTRKEREIAALRAPSGPGGSASWSPDGKLIALSVVSPPPAGGTTIAVFDADTGQRRDLFKRAGGFLGNVAWLQDGKGLVLSGFDIVSTLSNQVFILTYPGAVFRRVTNDFNQYGDVTTGAGEEAIASVRSSLFSNLYLADSELGTVRAITSVKSPEHSPFNVAVSDDRVFYCALRDEFVGLLSAPLAGGDPTPIATGSGHVFRAIAAAGTVVFVKFDTYQQIHIWRANADGTGVRQITSGTGEFLLDLSPDGSLVTFTYSDSSRGVWIVPASGGEPRLLSATAIVNTAPQNPGLASFSSDGALVVTVEFETDAQGLIRNVFKVIPAAGGDAIATLRIPPTAGDFASVPGNRAISFTDRADPASNVFSITSGGDTKVQISKFTDGRVTNHEWSKDGKRIAVVRRLADGENVWVINADGSQPKQITHFSGLDVIQMAWLPDSKRIVANAGQSGNDVVLIRDFR